MEDSYERPLPRRRAMPPPYPENEHHYPPSRGYVSMIVVGIIILMIGSILLVSWGFMDDPDSGDSGREEYYDNIRTISTLGKMTQFIGLIILSIGMIQGAISDNNIPINVRMGLLIAMGIIIGFSISSSYLGYINI